MKKFFCLFLSIFILFGIISPVWGGSGSEIPASGSKIGGETTTQGKTAEDVGINFGGKCLTGMGKGCFDAGKLIGIKQEQKGNISAMSILQDVVLSATYMVGTVLTIVIIYCGLGYIFASRDGKDVSKYRKGLISAAIGAILVRGAFSIVRLIQYIARG